MSPQPSFAFAAPPPPPHVEAHPDAPLRDYQLAALDAIREAQARGVRRQLVVMATGLGKGHLLGYVPAVVGARRTLVLCHRVEILDQLAGHLRRANPEYRVAVEQGGRCEGTPDHDVIVASVPTLASAKRRLAFAPDQFDLVMHDESHHAMAKSHTDVLRYFRVPEPDGPLLIGYTATPMRGDRQKLADLFDEVVFDKSLRPRKGQIGPIEEGWLCTVVPVRVTTETDISAVPTHSGDFSAGALETAINTADRNDEIISAINTHAAERTTILVFAAGVDHAETLTARMTADGIEARCVLGTTHADVRRRTWADFADGTVRCVVNVGVATEGFDCPKIDCLVMARPTKSPLLFTQMIGRGMRQSPGKVNLLVLDVSDACGKHRVQTVAKLFGLRVQDTLGTDVIAAAAVEARAAALDVEVRDDDTLEKLERRIRAAERRSLKVATTATPIDLFGEPDHASDTLPRRTGSVFPWLSVGSGEYALEIDRGSWATIRRNHTGQWCVDLSNAVGKPMGGENLTHSSPDGPDWQQADLFIKRSAGVWSPPDKPYLRLQRWKFLCHEAARRQRAATPAQLGALEKWRLPADEGMSYGAAHDALSRAVYMATAHR